MGQCSLGVVSKRKEDLGSSLISPLAVLGAVVFVWEWCKPAVVVVCLCAHVSMCDYNILPLLKCGESVSCYATLKP